MGFKASHSIRTLMRPGLTINFETPESMQSERLEATLTELKVKARKCQFEMEQCSCLGQVVDEDKLHQKTGSCEKFC